MFTEIFYGMEKLQKWLNGQCHKIGKTRIKLCDFENKAFFQALSVF